MHIKEYKDGFRVQIQHKQYRASKYFPNQGMCKTWAEAQLKEFKRIATIGYDDREPVVNLFARYMEVISPTKKGARWERLRLMAMSRNPIFKGVKISKITPETISKFRDERLKEVSAGTVLRDLSLLSGVFDVACKEWKMMATNPVANIRKPKSPPHREKIISDEEIAQFLAIIPWDPNTEAVTSSQRMGAAFIFAIATGMRCGEITALRGPDIEGRVAQLHVTKNGKPRKVPLSTEALRILSMLPDKEKLFDLKSAHVDGLFRKYRDKGKFEFRFHDTRHSAVTRMAKKIDVMNLAKIIGHSDTRTLLKYFNPTADQLAELLD